MRNQTVHTISIIDNDSMPVVSWSHSSDIVAESINALSLTATLDHLCGLDISVPFNVSGSATVNVDHNLSDGMIVIPSEQLHGAVYFEIIDDTLHEPIETLLVTMQTPENAVKGSPNVYTLTILDNDNENPPPIIVDPEGEYKTISQAISIAKNGNTIIVKPGTYKESIKIDKSLTILSEKGYEHTFVEGTQRWGAVFEIDADDVTIKGFTVYGGYKGICLLQNSEGAEVIQNRCGYSVKHHNTYGIYLSQSHKNNISGNLCFYNRDGIYLFSSKNNNISGNQCDSNNRDGIYLYLSRNNVISQNKCSSNGRYGIYLNQWSYFNTLIGNTIESSENKGLRIFYSTNNESFLNDFISNTENIISSSQNLWNPSTKLSYLYNESHYNNYLGNFYSDHNLLDSDNNGITDDVYMFSYDRLTDNHPLSSQLSNYVFQTWWFTSNEVISSNENKFFISKISANDTKIWRQEKDFVIANNLSRINSWTGQIVFSDALKADESLRLDIGYSGDDKDFNHTGIETSLTGDGKQSRLIFKINSGELSIPSGNQLAIRISNDNESGYDIMTGLGWSYITPLI
jgi:parallel beta-helix repeat protein